tara:strand:- start:164 stop:532 length:369 start_codon:yes stop_codon:yes gene_type:complete
VFTLKENDILFPISIGSTKQNCMFLGHRFERNTSGTSFQKINIAKTAFKFLDTSYRKGGKSSFGIDAAGFTQIVCKLYGVMLPRTASEQSALGEVVSFIEESDPGDLAFFGDEKALLSMLVL